MNQAEQVEDIGRDLAQWLAEAGQRVAPPQARRTGLDSSEERVRYLEELAGRPLPTRAHIRAYLDELNRGRLAAEGALSRRRLWRETLLLSLAACAFLQFYFWDVYLTIERLPRVTMVSAPANPAN